MPGMLLSTWRLLTGKAWLVIWCHLDPILNIVARDSKAILAAFGKSPTPEHLNQHQRKNREDLEKVHLKFSSFYDLFSKVQHLFVGCGRETVRYVIERYRLDFLMCGYKRTLEQLELLLWHQHLQKTAVIMTSVLIHKKSQMLSFSRRGIHSLKENCRRLPLVVNAIVVQSSISSINSCKRVALSLSAVSVLLTLTRKLKRRANERQMVGGDQNHLLIVSHFTQCDP